MIFSLLFFGIRPYRAAQQTLGENVADIARFLRIKADFYIQGNRYRRELPQAGITADPGEQPPGCR
jgi:hypothetical protein